MHAAQGRLAAAVLAAAAVVSSPCAGNDEEPSLIDAITRGTFSLHLRYRYEDVDQDSFEARGRASTLRTAAGYRTETWRGVDGFLEIEDVRDLGLSGDHDNAGAGSLWNGVTDRPVIADPALTEVNQAYLGWRPVEDLSIRFGLQELTVDNHRFIGNVGWRQNHQSFEAVSLAFRGIRSVTVSGAFIGRQHTIFGGSQPMSTGYLGVAYDIEGVATVKAYGLLLDYDREPQRALNSATLGVFVDGTADLSDRLRIVYRAEAAHQSDADNPNRISAGYLRADLGVEVANLTASAGYERLGGSAEDGQFRTPLATLHKFNGWADVFLSTPTDGLEDWSLTVAAVFGSFKLTAAFHDFSAAAGGAHWGSELDAEIAYSTPWQQQLALKLAAYDADELGADTRKLWLSTGWGF